MLYLTTLFDKNYLHKGLVLYESLKEHCSIPFELFILCLDEDTELFFISNASIYPNVNPVSLSTLEEADVELLTCKDNRSLISYYFTISPCLPLFLLIKYNLPHICSLDADMLFLSDPSPLFNYLNDFSIIITPHKFSIELKELEKNGLFNVSFQIFKNNMIGRACLIKWRNQCIEWCEDHVDIINSRFADQKYLDIWPEVYKNELRILDDNVSGLAPWNLNNYKIELINGVFFSNRERIIFYHFHNLKIINNHWAVTDILLYKVKISNSIKQLYKNYLRKIFVQYLDLNMPRSESLRVSYSSSLIENMLSKSLAYHFVEKKNIYQYNFENVPKILRRILIKSYHYLIRIIAN